MTAINILTFEKDGARLKAFDGQNYTVVCACGNEFERSKKKCILKHVKLRCRECYASSQGERSRKNGTIAQ